MLEVWSWPAAVGVVGGITLFVLLLIPLLVFQQRRYGTLDARRLLGAAALSVYLVALVAYTLLPLPSGDLQQWCAAHGVPRPNLEPFGFVHDISRETAGLAWSQRLRSAAVLQVVFNVALFVPWGMFVRRFFYRGVLAATVSGLAASVLIETTQYTGIWGLIPCSYRVGDVDDVIMNTAGALLGALVAPLVLRWMPRARDLEARRLSARPVTLLRRWTGMLVDAGLLLLADLTLVVAYRVGLLASGRELPLEPTWTQWWIGSLVPFVVLVVLPAVQGNGASPGQRAVWLSPTWGAGGRTPLGRQLLRAMAGSGGWWLLLSVGDLPVDGPVPTLGSILAPVLAVVMLVSAATTAGHRGLSCLVTGARMVDARAGAQRHPHGDRPAQET